MLLGVAMAANSDGHISVWPQRTIRFFAAANLAFGALGLVLMADFPIHLDQYLRLLRQSPDQLPIFCLLAAVDFACLVLLIYSAVPLWRLRASGRLICNVLSAFELVATARLFVPWAFLTPGTFRPAPSCQRRICA